MRKHLVPWLPITALLVVAPACTSKSSKDGNASPGSTTTAGGGSTGATTSSGTSATTSSGTSATTSSGGSSGSGSGGSAGDATTTTGSNAGAAGAAGAAGETSDGGSGNNAGGGAGGTAGGTGGTGGTGGSTTTGTMLRDNCEASEVEPNDDRDSAFSYTLGTEFDACLQSIEDVDVYEFSIPADDRGGVATVHLTEVGPNGDMELAIWAAADNGEFFSTGANIDGASVYAHFTAAPGARFFLEVTNYLDVREPNPYRLSIEYQQVPDEHEPNQIRSQAVSIDVGEEVEGYIFAGWTNSTGIPEADWYDWYSIELEAGETSFLVDVLASDADHEIVLYDPIGTQITSEGTPIDGSSVLLEYEVPEAGTYFVRVNPYNAPPTSDDTLDIPEYASIPYVLTVTQ